MKKMTTFLLVVLIGYAAILAFFFFAQKSMLFYPQPLTYKVQLHENLEEVSITTPENLILKGWLCKSESQKPHKLIIYFGGNAEEVSHMIPMASLFEGWALLLINYPGYGESEGKPGQKQFFEAALSIYDYAATRTDIDPENIMVMGRSIGTGVATYLASQKETKAVVLISPFGSIQSVAQQSLPFLPVGLLLRHPFRSEKYAKKIEVPLLAFYGTVDNIIPPKHTHELVDSWKGRTTLVELEGYGHNDVFESQRMWEEINWFLKAL
jgi:uncharacterized protein